MIHGVPNTPSTVVSKSIGQHGKITDIPTIGVFFERR
jgi:hypothetical protein